MRAVNGTRRHSPPLIGVALATMAHEQMLGFKPHQVFVVLAPGGFKITSTLIEAIPARPPRECAGWFDWRVPFEDFYAALEVAAKELQERVAKERRQ